MNKLAWKLGIALVVLLGTGCSAKVIGGGDGTGGTGGGDGTGGTGGGTGGTGGSGGGTGGTGGSGGGTGGTGGSGGASCLSLISEGSPCAPEKPGDECPYTYGDACYSFTGKGVCTEEGTWTVVDLQDHNDCCPPEKPQVGSDCSGSFNLNGGIPVDCSYPDGDVTCSGGQWMAKAP